MPSPTLTPSAVPTWTNTPLPTAPTITPTQTITPGAGLPPWTTPVPTLAVPEGFLHILLIGADGSKYVKDQNTDVMIVAVVDRSRRQVSLLSIPRDLWVYIPTFGWGRINIAHRVGHQRAYPRGGAGLLMDTIEHNFGIPIDHWARVDFNGFARVVDELGGVDMVVACPVNLRYRPPTSDREEEMWLQPGVYHMDGETALRYVRTRRGADDFQRAPRQQKFLKAVWDQTRGPGMLGRIPGLWSALKDSFETDLSLVDVLSLAPLALELRPERIRSRYIGPGSVIGWTTEGGAQVQLPQHDKIQQMVSSLYAPPSVSMDQVAGEGARIKVLNGTERAQLALIAADQLRWQGLTVVHTGPANSLGHEQTQIVVVNDKPQAMDTLKRLLNVKSKNIVYQPNLTQTGDGVPADLIVILGQDYDPCP
jgi:LCP family protein required for cell wall assembly